MARGACLFVTPVGLGSDPGDQAGDARVPGCELLVERSAGCGSGVPVRTSGGRSGRGTRSVPEHFRAEHSARAGSAASSSVVLARQVDPNRVARRIFCRCREGDQPATRRDVERSRRGRHLRASRRTRRRTILQISQAATGKTRIPRTSHRLSSGEALGPGLRAQIRPRRYQTPAERVTHSAPRRVFRRENSSIKGTIGSLSVIMVNG